MTMIMKDDKATVTDHPLVLADECKIVLVAFSADLAADSTAFFPSLTTFLPSIKEKIGICTKRRDIIISKL